MAPKKAADAGKRKKEMILLEDKKEIIRKHEGGMRLTDLAKEYGRSASTIGTILKVKEKITGRNAAKGVTRVSKQWPPVLEEVEKLILLWIKQKQRAGDSVTKAIICEKAKALHADLLKQQPGTSADAEGFKASRGCFKGSRPDLASTMWSGMERLQIPMLLQLRNLLRSSWRFQRATFLSRSSTVTRIDSSGRGCQRVP
ncbi:tigger transposable element-derived 1-like [Pelobates cultripes]|uniref:Tigger transposable element-derived 1-like n=1 Tax=Pelobates cultripes TaxID=61616 RepID=A0AAD1VQ60_PELCU|nr:tigger transposable element-derived 1-like [Pelobates cultripes]